MTAYELGWRDAESGKAITSCPFHLRSGAAIAWRAGYREFFKS
jgi:hypothetical protein